MPPLVLGSRVLHAGSHGLGTAAATMHARAGLAMHHAPHAHVATGTGTAHVA